MVQLHRKFELYHSFISQTFCKRSCQPDLYLLLQRIPVCDKYQKRQLECCKQILPQYREEGNDIILNVVASCGKVPEKNTSDCVLICSSIFRREMHLISPICHVRGIRSQYIARWHRFSTNFARNRRDSTKLKFAQVPHLRYFFDFAFCDLHLKRWLWPSQ